MEKKMSNLEKFKVLALTILGVSIPIGVISFLVNLIFKLSIPASISIGLLITVLIIIAFGLHKPASDNCFVEEEEDDD